MCVSAALLRSRIVYSFFFFERERPAGEVCPPRATWQWNSPWIPPLAKTGRVMNVFLLFVWPNSSPALRDLWWNRLGQAVKDERDKEPKTTTIQITYHDAVQAIGYVSISLLLFFFFMWVPQFVSLRCVLPSTSNHISVTGGSDTPRSGMTSSDGNGPWRKKKCFFPQH